jgi:hypothetical protein
MLLPTRTTLKDIEDICKDLVVIPSGSNLAVGSTMLKFARLDQRKVEAPKFWGLIAEDEERMLSISPAGRELARGIMGRSMVLSSVVYKVVPYRAIIEMSYNKKVESISLAEVSSYWFQHFRRDLAKSKGVRYEQVSCFIHIAVGAELGRIVDRAGSETRLTFNQNTMTEFLLGKHNQYEANEQ